ncbi:MAG: hypothetical protein ACHQF2_04355 [Flavobacteriales bacterium]
MKGIIIIATLVGLAGCSSFESKYFDAVETKAAESVKSHKPVLFNLSEITDFSWDSVFVIYGNESVSINAVQIESNLQRKTIDLPIGSDRFYFLKTDKSIVTYEISSSIAHKPAVEIVYCRLDSLRVSFWLSKDDAIFHVVPNSKNTKEGTVFLFPGCYTNSEDLNTGIFYKE